MRTLALIALVAALPASAQDPAAAAEPSAPVPEVSQPPPPPAVSAPSLPPAFFERYVQVDFGGHTWLGKEKKPLSRVDLFTLAGRTDLVARSESNRTRRTWYTVAAVSLGALTLGATAAFYFTGPDLTTLECAHTAEAYNKCLADTRTHQALAITSLAVGTVGTVLLATLAAWADPNVLNRDETVELVSKYNAQLARSLKQSGLMLTPVVGPGQVGLVARGTFP